MLISGQRKPLTTQGSNHVGDSIVRSRCTGRHSDEFYLVRRWCESDREKNEIPDGVMIRIEAWAADLRSMRHIGDFRGWKKHEGYKKGFGRLMRDLRRRV